MNRGAYLISPVDFVNGDAAHYHQERSRLVAMLSSVGFAVFQPHLSFSCDATKMDVHVAGYIEEVNRAALSRSAVAIAYLPYHTPTIGCGVEMEICRRLGIPVVVLTDKHSPSVMLSVMAKGVYTDMLTAVNAAVRLASDRTRHQINSHEDQFRDGVTRFAPYAAEVTGRKFPDFCHHPAYGGVVELGYHGVVHKDGSVTQKPNSPEVLVYEDPEDRDPALTYGIDEPKLPGDVGHDLHATQTVTIPAYGQADVPTKVFMDMQGLWAIVFPRSSTSRARLYVSPGIIDVGYQGEMLINVVNLNDHEVTIKEGDRPAQAVFFNPVIPTLTKVPSKAEFNHSVRGERGWGSTNEDPLADIEQLKLDLEIEGRR